MSDRKGTKPGSDTSGREPPRAPTAREASAIEKARAFRHTRTQPLRYTIETAEGGTVAVSAPHTDAEGFRAQQGTTFGTVSSEFALGAASVVGDLMRPRGQPLPDAGQLNAGVAAVAGIEPRDEAEAMLAVQMVGTHTVAVDMLSRAKQANTLEALDRYGTLATKLLRTYTAQIEALAKLRRRGEQTVRVEHVHVHSGGQAIVGHITTDRPPGGGGHLENERQPHALTGPSTDALPAEPALLCSDTHRQPVPVARREGQSPLPDARRRSGKRRTQR